MESMTEMISSQFKKILEDLFMRYILCIIKLTADNIKRRQCQILKYIIHLSSITGLSLKFIYQIICCFIHDVQKILQDVKVKTGSYHLPLFSPGFTSAAIK